MGVDTVPFINDVSTGWRCLAFPLLYPAAHGKGSCLDTRTILGEKYKLRQCCLCGYDYLQISVKLKESNIFFHSSSTLPISG
jgi:hypothetical protein